MTRFLVGPRAAGELAEMLRERRSRGFMRRQQFVAPAYPPGGGSATKAAVLGSESIGAHRWEYLLRLPDDSEVVGYNELESDNTAATAAPGISADELPDGFSVRPIGEDAKGRKVECIVDAWLEVATGFWWFSMSNAVDGACPAESGGGVFDIDGGEAVYLGGEVDLDGGSD